jgi:hypothetical protein
MENKEVEKKEIDLNFFYLLAVEMLRMYLTE